MEAQITMASTLAERAPYILFGVILGVLLACIVVSVSGGRGGYGG